ncbi:hypothetical protein [Parendozoicomonas sp. Alg238-R29]|uniref:Rz1-like lysis system protein LysC n=1 Tax=Parendozoicomonas sp. Alg238-R29 TaxID=2993446 RepID=UPI00248E8490|nr:hypothetical protein [Parendozoicomonas sp. Alg238-R29]
MILSACSTVQPPVVKTRLIVIKPPMELTQECQTLERQLVTNADLARLAIDQQEALARCNADKRAMREWIDSSSQPQATTQ